MALYLVTCVCDEGVYETNFRVVEASSRLAVADSMVRNPYRWKDYLERSHLLEGVQDRRWSGEKLLESIDSSSVDGDSRFRLSLYEIKTIENCD